MSLPPLKNHPSATSQRREVIAAVDLYLRAVYLEQLAVELRSMAEEQSYQLSPDERRAYVYLTRSYEHEMRRSYGAC